MARYEPVINESTSTGRETKNSQVYNLIFNHFFMTGFKTPEAHRIFCSFRDKQKEDVEISEDTYNKIRDL
jgi:hypothetical protein